MLLDKIYGLLNHLEFKFDHFCSLLLLAESQFQNSNVGGKYSLISLFLNPKSSEESSTLLDNFIKHTPLISEVCCVIYLLAVDIIANFVFRHI